MSKITSEDLGKRVSITLISNGTIDQDFSNVSVEGIINYQTALRYQDVAAFHAGIYPSLPEGVPNDYTAYYYVHLILANGENFPIGLPWINTVTVLEKVKAQFTFNDLNASQVNDISDILRSNNIHNFVVNVI